MSKPSKKQTIVGPAMPNIPWEDKPKKCRDVVWRYSQNPIVPRDLIPTSNSIFNSAAVPLNGQFAGVFRVDHWTRRPQLHKGTSVDGINWEIEHEPIHFHCDDPEIGYISGYDPRVCQIENRYYVTWCNNYNGPTIGMAYTDDFQEFHQLENAFLIYNRNGVLFPRKIRDKYVMLSRPSGPGHNAYGNIFCSESPDLTHWGCHRLVMRTCGGWQGSKIGAGPVPIETTEGWLLIYHGVLISCNGFVYSAGAALLDLDEPWRVLYRTAPYIISPQTLYECVGDVPNVVFPCAALCDAETGRIAIYYGAADTVTALAFTQVDELIAFTKANSVPT
jgi:beta-1,4-mannooligosaccharide/beta-1,4-mannosyl-N-acetylglucosamine phosphorylase